MTSIFQFAADWLLSWWMHATVACILTLAAGRWLVADPRLRDLLWKAALLLPLGTSLVSVAVSPATSNALDLVAFVRPHMPLPLRSASVSVETTSAAIQAMIHVQDATAQWLLYLVLGAMLIPAAAATSRLVKTRRRFRKILRTRWPTDAEELRIDARVLSLGRRTARISMTPHIVSAAAVARREICVSTSFSNLRRVERHAVIAHEIAHLERRDLAWLAFADAVACALAAQPLVRVVARRQRRDAEFICDEIAVRRTGNAPAYVRALTLYARAHDAIAVPAVAYGSSLIVQRAERVLGLSGPRRPPARIAAAFVAMVLLSSLIALPRVSTGEASRRVRAQVSARRSSGSHSRGHIKVTLDVR
jgi:beta-lactamase regulating signal transducer with metallopeptidase domain